MDTWAIGYLARVLASGILGIVGFIVAKRYYNFVGVKSLLVYFFAKIILSSVIVYYGVVPPDVSGWQMHGEWIVKGGLVPGRDFLSPYYMGFNGLIALSIWLWDSPVSIIILFSLVELLALICLYRGVQPILGEKICKRMLILYLTSPIWSFCSFFGAQDEVLCLLGVSILIMLLFTEKLNTWLIFIFTFFGIAVTKLLAVFYFQPLLFARKYRTLWMGLGALGSYVLLAIYAGVNPFNLIFGREPGLSAMGDRIANMVTLGNVCFYFKAMGGISSFGAIMCIISFGLVGLFFVKYLLTIDRMDKKRAFVVISSLMMAWCCCFNLFYSMTFNSYLLPFVPIVLSILLYQGSKYILVTYYVWASLVAYKDSFYWHYKTFETSGWQVAFSLYNIVLIVLCIIVLIQSLSLVKYVVLQKK